VYVDAVHCDRWLCGLSVCHDHEPAKMAEQIKMPFGLWTWLGPRNRMLDGGPGPVMQRGNFEGERGSQL